MGRYQRLRSAVLSAGATFGLLLLTGVAAQTDSADGNEREIFAGLLAGRDVSAAVAAYAESREQTDKDWTDPDRFVPDPLGRSHQDVLGSASRAAGRLSRADQPWQKGQELEGLLARLNQLQGQQMILEQRARQDLERLRNVEQAQDNVSRGEEALQRFASALAEIDDQIAIVQSLPGKSVASRSDQREWRSALAGVGDTLKALAGQTEQRARPILRALPFDRPLISPGPLVTSPGITPSYEQAEPQPGGSADLAATKGAPLSDIILAKAAELGNDYVAIHEFVRSQIRTEYYSGAMKRAETTLRTRSGNDVDQASLLIALYRASNVPARYVHGVARVAIEQVGAPLGLSNAQQVLTALSRSGIPHEPVIQGGQIGAVDMAATWVSIYVPYANYRGVPVDLAGRIWLPLAPALKQHSFEPASGIAAASGLDGEALVNSYLADQIADPPLVAARNQVEDNLAANPGLGGYTDQLGAVSVAAASMKLLPAGLPFEVVAVTEESAKLGPDRQQTLTLLVADALGQPIMDQQVALADLLDKRLTLSYAPATVGDFNTIREFGGRTAVPAYLVRLRPQLKADGVAVATAEGDLGMGDAHGLTLELRSPGGIRTANATLTAGSYAAIGLSAQLGLPEVVSDSEALADDSEGRAARLLYNQAVRYASLWDEAEGELAGLFDLAVVRPLPALALVSTSVQVSQIQGLNSQLTFEAANLDAALRSVEPISRSGDPVAESQWMRLAALQGSYLESTVFESQWAVESISADKGLRQAVRQTLPVTEIDAANAGAVIPGLSHPPEVIEAVQGAVDQGYRVLIPESEITLNAWTGSVWHSWDPDLGSSGYFISGGLAGGSTTEAPADWILDDLANTLGNPYGGEPNTDPDAAAQIRIVPTSDGQFGKSGENLDKPLTVLVTDVDGRPVQGASVRFNVVLGDARVGTGASPDSNFTTTTDSGGLAQAPVLMGTSTAINPLYLLLEPGDEFSTQVSENWVSATVTVAGGFTLSPERPFFLYTLPDDPAQLVGVTSPPVAYPLSWAGPAQARLEDQYGNPVSNREIRYTALPAIPPDPNVCLTDVAVSPARLFTGDECAIPSTPGLDCGFPEVTVTSNVFGPFVQVVTGEGALGIGLPLEGRTRWPVEVSSPGVPSISFAVSTLESLTRNEPSAVTVVTRGTFDNILDSALVGEIAPAPRLALTFRADGGLCTPLSYGPDDADVAYRVVDRDEDGAFIINEIGTAPGIPVAPMTYEAYLPVGPEPIVHSANLDLTFPSSSGSLVTTSSRTIGITAVEAEIVSVSPVPVPLNLNGETTAPIEVEYSARPANLRASLQINLLEDGNVIDFKFLARGPNEGTVAFTPGKQLDILKDYTVQLLVNPRTPFEIATDTFPVELTEPIVKSVLNRSGGGGGPVVGNQVRRGLNFVNDIDIPNERICRTADVEVELTQEATLSFSFERLDASGDPTGQVVEVLSNVTLPAGISPVEVSADDLGTDIYAWRIDAVSAIDGRTDVVTGSASSRFVQRNTLPVGHPVVKGVDLATGKMVLSRQDFNVQGLGAGLQFIRTYASGARNQPGVVGSGWSHNYMSSVQLTNCGEYVVTGAEGGSINFVREGAGFRPLKGYHGSLVETPDDGGFDFFPKSGARYRYGRRQDNTWYLESIEDTNGNRTELTYDVGTEGPRLTTVTDPSGRTVSFVYESRSFRAWSGDVITQVVGPGGITVTLDYDEFGNQISADREAGASSETYTYLTGGNIGNANLLVTATDNRVSATQEFNYDEITLTVPIGSFSLPVLSSTVGRITETDGGQTTFTYTAGPWGMNSQAVVVDGNGNSTTTSMNEYGAATSIAAPNGTRTNVWETDTDVLLMSETDENGRLTSFTYDGNGNVLTEQVGSLTRSFTYANLGMIKNRAATVTNFRGFTTTNDYDAAGNLLSSTLDGVTETFTYDASGLRRTATDGNGNATTFGYDQYGYLASQTNPEGGTSSFTYDDRGRRLTERDPNGNTTRFDYDGRDRVTLTTYADSSTLQVDYAGRVRTETDGRGGTTVTTTDALGRIISVRNAAGDTQTSTYDANGNKRTSTDVAGRVTTYDYDGANRLTSQTQPEGKVTTFTYDGVGNVRTETVSGPGGSRGNTFDYDPDRYFQTSVNQSGLALTTFDVDGEGNVTSETDPEGRVTTFTYDAFNRLTSADGPLGSGRILTYDGVGNLLTETTRNSTGDQLRRFAYDGANRQVQTIDAEGAIISTEYDAAGNVLRSVDGRGRATEFGYNERNRRVLVRDPEGGTTRFVYDLNGNLAQQTQANGNVLSYTYDLLNRRTSESDSIGPISTTTYDAVGNVLTQTNGRGNTTTNTYDGLNRLLTAAQPGGRTTTFTYNVFGEVTSETDPGGNTVNNSYDDLGRRTATTGPAGLSLGFTYDLVGNLLTSTDSRNNTTTNTYNQLNQRVSTQDPLYTQSFTYDLLGNLLTETDRRGIVSEFRYDRENRNTQFSRAGTILERKTYDASGNLLFLEDANGNVIGYEYDGRNLVSRESRPELSITTFVRNDAGDVITENRPAGRSIQKAYDARHRQTSETNPAGEERRFEYDLNDNRTAVIEPQGTWRYEFDVADRLSAVVDPLGSRSTYEYDTRDNRVAQVDANLRRTEFSYDERNRKTEKRYPDSAVVGLDYDSNSNLVERTEPNGTVATFTYDALDREISRSFVSTTSTITVALDYDPNGNPVSVTETDSASGGGTTTQTFGSLDRLILVQDRFGQQLQYAYDANGNRTQLLDNNGQATQYSYDGLNRLISMGIPGLGTAVYVYLPNSLLERLEYPNGAVASYQYDLADRVTEIVNSQGGENVAVYRYQYDASGNRIRQEEENGNGLEVTTYGYDAAGRLDQVSYPDRDVDYTLDAVGNRLTETIVTAADTVDRSFTYNTRDQLETVSDSNGALNISYGYDANGNQVSKSINGELTEYTYDARNRIADVTIAGSPAALYEYDYKGLRVAKEVAGTRTQYVYDDQSVLSETNTLGNTVARYHYGSDRRLAEARGGQNSYFLQDALRTTIAITDQVGALVARYTYDAWGNRTRETGTSEQPFGFTGYLFDAETGLYYAKQRFYDAFTGRFLSEDPFDGDTLSPPSLHRYLYALVNPTVFIDPTGQIPLFRDVLDRFTETSEILRNAADSLNTVEGNIFQRGAAKVGAGLLGALNVTVTVTSGFGELANAAANGLVQSAEIAVNSAGGDFGEFGQAVAEENQQFSDGIRTAVNTFAEDPIGVGTKVLTEAKDTVVAAAQGDTAAIFDVTTFVGEELLVAGRFGPGRVNATPRRPTNIVDDEVAALRRIQANQATPNAVALNQRINARGNRADSPSGSQSRIQGNQATPGAIALNRRINERAATQARVAEESATLGRIGANQRSGSARALNDAINSRQSVRVPNEAGVIREFATRQDQVFFRVFTGNRTEGSFLTAVPPRSSAFAREALALPRNNRAQFIQEVLVPAGTNLRRSRARPIIRNQLFPNRRGGAEQFELLDRLDPDNFGRGVPLE